MRLAECENSSLHAIFVTRGNEEYKQKCLKAQLDLLTGEDEPDPDDPNNPDIPDNSDESDNSDDNTESGE